MCPVILFYCGVVLKSLSVFFEIGTRVAMLVGTQFSNTSIERVAMLTRCSQHFGSYSIVVPPTCSFRGIQGGVPQVQRFLQPKNGLKISRCYQFRCLWGLWPQAPKEKRVLEVNAISRNRPNSNRNSAESLSTLTNDEHYFYSSYTY